jgi:hypothetical protein
MYIAMGRFLNQSKNYSASDIKALIDKNLEDVTFIHISFLFHAAERWR